MSRIGRKPIAVPANVKVEISGQVVAVQGPKGKQQVTLPAGIQVQQQQNVLTAVRTNDSLSALHGLMRSLVANAVAGVSTGFQKELDIVGTGYRAELKGKSYLVLSLGYSHLIEFPIPPGIEIAVDGRQTHLVVSGGNRQQVGQIAAEIRSLRPPDPYKNKGVRYTGEKLRKKVGKTGSK